MLDRCYSECYTIRNSKEKFTEVIMSERKVVGLRMLRMALNKAKQEGRIKVKSPRQSEEDWGVITQFTHGEYEPITLDCWTDR